MTDQDERHWEHFSDRLSDALDGMAETQALSPETIDILHLAAVRIYLEDQENIVEQWPAAKPLRHVLH